MGMYTKGFNGRILGFAAGIIVATVWLMGSTAQADICAKSHRSHRPVYSSEGLFFSFAPGWMDFDGEFTGLEDRRKGGAGFISLAYGLSQHVTLFANLEGAGITDRYNDEWAMGFFDIGLKYSFTPDTFSKVRPYILGSIGGAALVEADDFDDDRDARYYGGSGRVAAGIDYFIGRRAMLFAEVSHRGGTFDRKEQCNVEVELATERDFTSTGFHVGLRLGF